MKSFQLTFTLTAIGSLVLAPVITYALIVSKIDWNWAVFFNQHDLFVMASLPFILLGMIVPLLIPLLAFVKWKICRKNSYLLIAQKSFWAFCISYFVMTVLKVFTNRVDMEPFEPLGEVDISNQFRFGFMNSEGWWESFSEGWPSGHTMIAVSVAISIHRYLSKKYWRYINIGYAICISFSVSTAFHWISDVVSGAIIGLVIGWGVLNHQKLR